MDFHFVEIPIKIIKEILLRKEEFRDGVFMNISYKFLMKFLDYLDYIETLKIILCHDVLYTKPYEDYAIDDITKKFNNLTCIKLTNAFSILKYITAPNLKNLEVKIHTSYKFWKKEKKYFKEFFNKKNSLEHMKIQIVDGGNNQNYFSDDDLVEIFQTVKNSLQILSIFGVGTLNKCLKYAMTEMQLNKLEIRYCLIPKGSVFERKNFVNNSIKKLSLDYNVKDKPEEIINIASRFINAEELTIYRLRRLNFAFNLPHLKVLKIIMFEMNPFEKNEQVLPFDDFELNIEILEIGYLTNYEINNVFDDFIRKLKNLKILKIYNFGYRNDRPYKCAEFLNHHGAIIEHLDELHVRVYSGFNEFFYEGREKHPKVIFIAQDDNYFDFFQPYVKIIENKDFIECDTLRIPDEIDWNSVTPDYKQKISCRYLTNMYVKKRWYHFGQFD